MAQLIVRNLDDAVVKKLRQRAAADGLSVEETHRRLLREVLLKPAHEPRLSTLKEHLVNMPAVGEDTDFVLPRGANRPFPAL
jgi:plasmid stability protein